MVSIQNIEPIKFIILSLTDMCQLLTGSSYFVYWKRMLNRVVYTMIRNLLTRVDRVQGKYHQLS